MRKFLPLLLCFSFFIACSSNAEQPHEKKYAKAVVAIPADTNFHEGDIIFQTSQSGQSQAIQLATHSKYSHCGLLFKDNEKWFVYEAIQPVQKTPFNEWILRGDDQFYIVRRLKDADSLLTPAVLMKMRSFISKQLGKNYDLAFDWSDERMYCSELVWKTYHEATGLEIGKTKPLDEYDLGSPLVKTSLEKRYGKNIPYKAPMISPGSIFDSELLVTVRTGSGK